LLGLTGESEKKRRSCFPFYTSRSCFNRFIKADSEPLENGRMKRKIQMLNLLKGKNGWRRNSLSRTFLFQLLIKLTLLFFIIGCGKKSEPDYEPQYGDTPAVKAQKVEYIFAVHPLHNPERFFEIYQPLINYINAKTTAFSLKLESSKDYKSFENKLYNRKFHFALPNPYQSVISTKYGYHIFGKMGDDERFRGIIVARKTDHIRSVSQLNGEAISFPSATALAAAMMPKYYLKLRGLDVEKNALCRYVGSQESSVMNVYLGKTKAGCTWPPPWEMLIMQRPEINAALEIVWQTEPLINNGLVVRNDIPQDHLALVEKSLFELHNSGKGKTILNRMDLSRFEKIDNDKFVAVVESFLQKYKKEFGSLPNGEVDRK